MGRFFSLLAVFDLSEQGFLPVIYTWIQSRRQSPVQLPSEDDSLVPNKLDLEPEQLSGWKILLLWIPAACDLTGTTVCHSVYTGAITKAFQTTCLGIAPRVIYYYLTVQYFLANECRSPLHPRLNIPNGARGARALRRRIKRYTLKPKL